RHAIKLRAVRTLDKDAAAVSLDLTHAARAIAAASGKDDADGIGAGVLGERSEKLIDGQGQAMGPFFVVQQQPSITDDHFLFRREQVYAIGLNFDVVLGWLYGQVGMPGE